MEPCGRRLWSSDLIWYTFRKRFSSWEQWLRELEWFTILIESYSGRNGIREADGEAVRAILDHRVRTLIMGMEKIPDIGNKDLWRASVLLEILILVALLPFQICALHIWYLFYYKTLDFELPNPTVISNCRSRHVLMPCLDNLHSQSLYSLCTRDNGITNHIGNKILNPRLYWCQHKKLVHFLELRTGSGKGNSHVSFWFYSEHQVVYDKS